ncbi:nucleotide sugar dehydrogenase [Ectothiorhodospira lacustris]|uniref:nucleotide sugar dehydrogenase n=1 Tax=Ectothiorhodospira lacustris TaxID=2899127 RepID=UPI001EE8A6C9|nr:UDP-glucose/GDP-mannose dehydrogenase family protein [Ectothiorhodospira lacustris]MCG5510333.1 UDP-glucose/GDP-mannose dehydrogenase family protein [Ectothiorhodospira lacustris]MCG5522079.1 UDP-glucose/GDP-mannose dehydrogenase family protein [Ectothiorhodospira lacustris]
MRIAIFGMGYVGAVSAACLARDGHEVVGVDIDPHKLDLLRRGHSPIVEEGIQELTAQVVQAGRLTVTDDVSEAIRRSEVSFICVGTPSSRNGSQDLAAVRNVARQIGEALALTDHYHTVVLRSTVKPGTTLELVGPTLESASGKRVGEGFGLAFQPEFLREGSSIKDYDHPPFTVVGTDSERTLDQVKPIFEHLPCEFVGTGIGTAEMVKYACNAFHALKIVFANEVGRLSQSLGLDSREVMELVTRDRQLNISPAYLRPGFAFGGSCLPKDLRAVLYMAKEQDTELPMLGSLIPSNQQQIDHAVDFVLDSGKRRIGLIGLSFKSGTDDMRESPLVELAERLIGKGMDLKIHDPNVQLSRVIGANRRYIEETLPHIASLLLEDCRALIEHSEVIVLGLSDAPLVAELLAHAGPEQQVLDLVGLKDRGALKAAYQGICW